MKLKKILSMGLCLSMLLTLLAAPVYAADTAEAESGTLTLQEDWRLTGELKLEVPAGELLVIDGGGRYFIYEIDAGKLSGGGLGGGVYFAEGTIVYPETGSTVSLSAYGAEADAIMETIEEAITEILEELAEAEEAETLAEPEEAEEPSIEEILLATFGDADKYSIVYFGTEADIVPGASITLTLCDGENNFYAGVWTAEIDAAGEVTVSPGEPEDGEDNPSAPEKPSSNTNSSEGWMGSNSSSTPSTPAATTNPDGSTSTTTTHADGSTTTTTTRKDGSKTAETTNTDGSKTTETTAADGSTGTVKTDASGNITSAEATVSAKAVSDAASSGKAVTIPVAVKAASSATSAAAVDVTMPANSGEVTVEVPVTNLTNSTVAVIVHEDGTEEIVKLSAAGSSGVMLTLEGSATLKIVDNAKSFHDVSSNQWFAANVAWASSHEVMNGMPDGSFAPDASTSRAMVAQMLFNISGAEASGTVTSAFADVSAGQWFAESVTWAYENGVAQGDGTLFNADQSVTREQLMSMIYNYAKGAGYDVSTSSGLGAFTDGSSVSAWAQDAMSWAVANGIIGGMGDGTVAPQGNATRAQVATIMERFARFTLR